MGSSRGSCSATTGHLDSDTGERVLALIEALQEEFGFALLIATHDADVAARLKREVELHDGRVVEGDARMTTYGRLAAIDLLRAPGRTLTRALVLAMAVALLGSMLLFIGRGLMSCAMRCRERPASRPSRL